MKLFTCANFNCNEAEFVICGVPFDKNHSYRDGSADAPSAIRDASWEIETYLMEKEIDLADLKICDTGNIEVNDFSGLFERAGKIVEKFKNKKLIIIGGDHSITFPFVSAYEKNFKNISVLTLDAHFDLREEYNGSRNSNACVMRRVAEKIGCENLYGIGIRSAYRDDFIYAKNNNINFVPYHEIRDNGIDVVDNLLEKIKGKLYLSIDMDVVDSALAQGVENPEVEGISSQQLLELIRKIFRKCDVFCCDVVEVAPKYDNGITSILAARAIFEILGEWV
ncbi:agmatinase [Candidatus Altiarchaeales archaeon WOR_SM1_SCG]|nr:agmatinase [Candidatus Altiarchaeales archaeon WOR_SM1_SCG]